LAYDVIEEYDTTITSSTTSTTIDLYVNKDIFRTMMVLVNDSTRETHCITSFSLDALNNTFVDLDSRLNLIENGWYSHPSQMHSDHEI